MIFKEKIKDYTSACPNRFIGRKGTVPDMIVLHNTGGSKISSAHHWFLNPKSQTSAHFLVGKDGEVRQYVSLADGAWCNGTTTDRAKGHFYGNSENSIVRSRSLNANLYTVSAEFVGNVGEAFTKDQYETAVYLIDYIMTELELLYGSKFPLNRIHVVSHGEISPITRNTCGKNLAIENLIRDVRSVREERAYRKTARFVRYGMGRVALKY